MKMRGADAILRSLEAEGVDVMFGIPGGAIMPTYDAMAHGSTVRHVLARHEQGAGHMAEGYARASGKVGVAIATSGPGATNLVTPIADAWMDSTPLVCITGQVRTTLIGTDAFQECDITGVTMPIVKHSWLVQEAREIPEVMRAAFHVARSGRCGPVLVDVPRDVQEAELDFSYPETVDLPGWKPPTKVHPLQIREAARAIATAEKPVLYVGGGTLNADACDELLTLAEAGGLPVITTLMGKSAFPESHELHFGWPGMHGAKWSNIAMNTCDVLVAVGARFDDRVTGQARRVRTRGDRRASRHRRGRDLEAARGRHPGRGAAAESVERACRRDRASSAPRGHRHPRPGCSASPAGGTSSRSATDRVTSGSSPSTCWRPSRR